MRDFLMARILEEETIAQAAIDAHDPGYRWPQADGPDGAHFDHWNPWRVLAGCVAKRLILAAHRDVGPGVDNRADPQHALKAHACSTCGQYDEFAISWPCYTLRVLALEWVDHPSYQIEWRPQRLSSGVGRAPAASATPPASTSRKLATDPVPVAETIPAPGAQPQPNATPGQPAA